mmetsp:Transcript_78072/g.172338  ORF Transcript_78072/g.172338 Transcript_78072/m.172338 type:complete len:311 (+) Transcript_78072:44-976(+)
MASWRQQLVHGHICAQERGNAAAAQLLPIQPRCQWNLPAPQRGRLPLAAGKKAGLIPDGSGCKSLEGRCPLATSQPTLRSLRLAAFSALSAAAAPAAQQIAATSPPRRIPLQDFPAPHPSVPAFELQPQSLALLCRDPLNGSLSTQVFLANTFPSAPPNHHGDAGFVALPKPSAAADPALVLDVPTSLTLLLLPLSGVHLLSVATRQAANCRLQRHEPLPNVATLVARMHRRGQLGPNAGRRAGHCAASVRKRLLWPLRSPWFQEACAHFAAVVAGTLMQHRANSSNNSPPPHSRNSRNFAWLIAVRPCI